MSTTQNELYLLGNRIRDLTDLFENDENGDNIFSDVTHIKEVVEELGSSHKLLENQMNLIIKLLSKNGQ